MSATGGSLLMNTNHVLTGPLSRALPSVWAFSSPRWQMLALGAGALLMAGLASLGIWLIRLALRSR